MKSQFTMLSIFLTLIFSGTLYSQKHREIEKTIKLSFGDINLRIDTFDIPEDGNLSNVVIFHDKYYIMLETYIKNTTQDFKKLLVLDMNGNFLKNVSIPNKFQDITYYDLSVENDSLFIKETQFEEYTFVLDEKDFLLKHIKKRELKSYQDSDYNIYKIDHGEWGGTTYFQNKTNDSVYKIEYLPDAINRIDSTYYLTHSKSSPWGYSSLLKINDPQLLQKSNLDFNVKSVDEKLVGGEVVFENKDYVIRSFVFKKKLLHIINNYSDKKNTYICEIINNKILPLYEFDFQFSAFPCMQYDNGLQIFRCFIHDKKYEKWINYSFMPFNDNNKQKPLYNKGAILIIDGKNITFHILN